MTATSKNTQLVLRELLHPRTWKPSEDRSFLLSAEQINQLCDTAESIFREEPSVLQLQGERFGFLRWCGESAAHGRAVLVFSFPAVCYVFRNAAQLFTSRALCSALSIQPQAHFSAFSKLPKTLNSCPRSSVSPGEDLRGLARAVWRPDAPFRRVRHAEHCRGHHVHRLSFPRRLRRPRLALARDHLPAARAQDRAPLRGAPDPRQPRGGYFVDWFAW